MCGNCRYGHFDFLFFRRNSKFSNLQSCFSPKVHLWTLQVIFSAEKCIYGRYEPPISGRIPYIWTSMSITSHSKDYFWTSMPILSHYNSYYWTSMPILSQSEKLLYVLSHPAGLCLGKMTISGILEHTHFQKVCISLF